jgi:hypothetical protein
MPRKSLGPRLYFRAARTHSTRGTFEPGRWLIRDGTAYLSTGFGDGQMAQAETALKEYIDREGGKRQQLFVYFIYMPRNARQMSDQK